MLFPLVMMFILRADQNHQNHPPKSALSQCPRKEQQFRSTSWGNSRYKTVPKALKSLGVASNVGQKSPQESSKTRQLGKHEGAVAQIVAKEAKTTAKSSKNGTPLLTPLKEAKEPETLLQSEVLWHFLGANFGRKNRQGEATCQCFKYDSAGAVGIHSSTSLKGQNNILKILEMRLTLNIFLNFLFEHFNFGAIHVEKCGEAKALEAATPATMQSLVDRGSRLLALSALN